MKEARGAIEMVLAVLESHRQGGPVALPMTNLHHPFADWAG